MAHDHPQRGKGSFAVEAYEPRITGEIGSEGRERQLKMATETAARRVMESKPKPTANAALRSGMRARGDQVALAYRNAGELLQALASRRISSRELVDGAISRIEALDQKINAVVVRRLRSRDCFAAPAMTAKATTRVSSPLATKPRPSTIGRGRGCASPVPATGLHRK